MSNKTIKTASVLAFERKLSNSDAEMYSGSWNNRLDDATWEPIVIQEKDVRGTISNRLKKSIGDDPVKLDAEIQKPNLQRVDVASLPFNSDTLRVKFTLRILGGVAVPCACNDQAYQEVLVQKINSYIEQNKFSLLAKRYAENIANGRFLWRNRIGAESIEIIVKHTKASEIVKKWIFNAYDFSLRNFSSSNNALEELAVVIQEGLLSNNFTFLEIDAFVKLGCGQEVFPSQELVLDNGRDSSKSKYLYQVKGIAAMHSQKIGNALRTIDTWYPGSEEVGPISVEPYGSVTSRGVAYRQPKEKMDFYNLLDNWIVKDKAPEIEQQHYVVAGLIRGGVFGEKSE